MLTSKSYLRFVAPAMLLTLTWIGAPAEAAAPKPTALSRVLEMEYGLVQQRMGMQKTIVDLGRVEQSLQGAYAALEQGADESTRLVDAYRVSRASREHKAKETARSLYKLSHGGALRLVLESPSNESNQQFRGERVRLGRSLTKLVKRELVELDLYRNSETRAGQELLASKREAAGIAAIHRMGSMYRTGLRALAQRVDSELDDALRLRRKAELEHASSPADKKLRKAIREDRRKLQSGRGFDWLEDHGLRRPVAGKVVGRFGAYRDRLLKLPMNRSGVEISANAREKVRAVASGKVAYVGAIPGYDRAVVLDHGDGYLTMLARMLEIQVQLGDEVKRGDVVGRVAPKHLDDGLGRTVYLELRHAERKLDPKAYLQNF